MPATPQPQSRCRRRERVAATLLAGAALVSGTAHLLASLPVLPGWAGVVMVGMGLVCLGCLLPLAPRLRRRSGGTHRIAAHMMAMTVAMVLLHMTLLVSAHPGGHANHGRTASAAAGGANHLDWMLLVVGIELVCLAATSVSLRLARSASSPSTFPSAASHAPAVPVSITQQRESA